MKRVVFRMSEEVAKSVRKYAKTKDLELGEAAEELIAAGLRRKAALSTYATKKAAVPQRRKRKSA